MAAYQVPVAAESASLTAKPAELVCFGLIVVTIVYLASSYWQGSWLLTPDGKAIETDFVTTWAAGQMARAGHAAAAYDWSALKLVDAEVIGGPFYGYLGWPYPPIFLLFTSLLSLLPYASAFVFWVAGTFAAYLVTIRAIVGSRAGHFIAAAFPAVLSNFIVGQNGFLSASLIGGAILLIEEKPLYAGALLGLMSFKPHLAVLFPIVLVASGRWKVLISAGITTVLLMALSLAVFGSETWEAFFLGIGSRLAFEALVDVGKLQSAFGLTVALGGSEHLAWIVQIVVALSATIAISVLWRTPAHYELKAGALGVGVLLVPSHLMMYDLVVLAVPLAFLIRLGWRNGFLSGEMAGIGLAFLLLISFPFVQVPVGAVAVLIMGALILRRVSVADAFQRQPVTANA